MEKAASFIFYFLVAAILIFIPEFLGFFYGSSAYWISYILDDPSYQNINNLKQIGVNPINSDFQNIYVPIQDAVSNSYANGFKFYDFNRISGFYLSGHPIAAPYNILNYFFKGLYAPNAIYIKSCIFLSLQGYGFYLALKTFKKDINIFLILACSLLLIFSPNNIYYIHWDNYLGIVCLFPFYIYSINKFIESNKIHYLFIGTFLTFLQPILNMVEMSFYLFFIFGIYCFSLILFARNEVFFITLKRILFYFLFCLFGMLISLPILIDLLSYSGDILREPKSFWDHLSLYPFLPKNIYQLSSLVGVPLPNHTALQHSIFLTITFIAILFLSFLSSNKNLNYLKSLKVSLVVTLIFLFIGFVDIPLLISDTYKIFFNQSRAVSFFYFFIWALVCIQLSEIKLKTNSQNKTIKKILTASLFLQILLFIGIFIFLSLFDYLVPGWLENSLHSFNYLFLFLFITLTSIAVYFYASLKSNFTPLIIFITFAALSFNNFFTFTSWEKKYLYDSSYERFFNSKTLVVLEESEFAESPAEIKRFLGGDFYLQDINSISGYDTGLKNLNKNQLNFLLDDDKLSNLKNSSSKWAQFDSYWVPTDFKKINKYLCNSSSEEDKKDFINKIILLGIGQILTDLSANCFDGFSSSSFLGLKLYKIHDGSFISYITDKKINSLNKDNISNNQGDWKIYLEKDTKKIIVPLSLNESSFEVFDERKDPISFKRTFSGFEISVDNTSSIFIKFKSDYSKWLYIQIMLILFILILFTTYFRIVADEQT